MGCHKVDKYGSNERDAHLVDGQCVSWLFNYVRPMNPGDSKGYHRLLLWVVPNGILNTEEGLLDKQVPKKP